MGGGPASVLKHTELAPSLLPRLIAAAAPAFARAYRGDRSIPAASAISGRDQCGGRPAAYRPRAAGLPRQSRARSRRGGPAHYWQYVEPEARLCTGICREELTLFQRVLESEVAVERVTHILEGAGRCAYRVTPL